MVDLEDESPEPPSTVPPPLPPGTESPKGKRQGGQSAPGDRSERMRASLASLGEIEDIRKMQQHHMRQSEKQHHQVEQVEGKVLGKGVRAQGTLMIEDASSPVKVAVHNMLSFWGFDAAIGVVICVNAATIGIDASYSAKDEELPTWVKITDYCILGIYVLELTLRLYAYRLQAFKSNWVRFDAFLIFSGVADIVLAAIAEQNDALKKVMMIRLIRLARLARMVRLISQFRVLWQLVQGLMNCGMTLLWTFLLILVMTYIFGVLGLELMASDTAASSDYNDAARWFNEGLGFSMLTLVQFLTLDSVGGIYRAIILEFPAMSLYFITFILVMSIALMNLVVAVMVESSTSQANEDREAMKVWEESQRKKVMPKLKAMFEELDSDGSHELELSEILNCPEGVKEQLQHITNMDNVEELFHCLDYDESGSLEIDEFCEGVIKAQGDKPLELLRLVRQCTDILRTSRDTLAILKQSGVQVEGLSSCDDSVSQEPSKNPDGQLALPGAEMLVPANIAKPPLTKEQSELLQVVKSLTGRFQNFEKRIDSRLDVLEKDVRRIFDHSVGW